MVTTNWILITEDTEDELYRLHEENYPIMIACVCDGRVYYNDASNRTLSFHTMSKFGNYYYCALNKLNTE